MTSASVSAALIVFIAALFLDEKNETHDPRPAWEMITLSVGSGGGSGGVGGDGRASASSLINSASVFGGADSGCSRGAVLQSQGESHEAEDGTAFALAGAASGGAGCVKDEGEGVSARMDGSGVNDAGSSCAGINRPIDGVGSTAASRFSVGIDSGALRSVI